MTPERSSYRRHRFPAEIISHAVWLYHVLSLSLRDVELILAERGVAVTHESIRHWCKKFGEEFAKRLRRRRPRPGSAVCSIIFGARWISTGLTRIGRRAGVRGRCSGSSHPAKRRISSRRTPSSTATSGHGVTVSAPAIIAAPGRKPFGSGNRRRASSRRDDAPHIGLVGVNSFCERLT